MIHPTDEQGNPIMSRTQQDAFPHAGEARTLNNQDNDTQENSDKEAKPEEQNTEESDNTAAPETGSPKIDQPKTDEEKETQNSGVAAKAKQKSAKKS